MLSEYFAQWMRDAPGYVLIYLALFGVPRLGIHGFLSAFWKLAENVAGARTEIGADFRAIKDSQAEIKQGIARLEGRHGAASENNNSITLKL